MTKHVSLRAGFAGLLLVSVMLTGCSSLDDRNAASVSAAAETDAGYDSLDAALAASIVRLESLASNPGAPTAFIADTGAVAGSLQKSADRLADARASLASRTEKQLAAMQEAAAGQPSPDGAKNLASQASALRAAHSDFEKAAAAVATELDTGLRELADARIAVGANATAGMVTAVKPSIDRAAGACRVARDRIGGAKKALASLRKTQPAPTVR